MTKYTLKYSDDTVPATYLASFPNGIPHEDAFEQSGEDHIEFHVYANNTKRKAQQRLLVGENAVMEYSGKNFGSDSMQPKHCKYVIGVVDKKSKIVTLHEAPTFAVKQRVKRMKFITELDGDDVEDKRTDYEKTIAAKTTLVESFGARRNLQAIQSAQRNRVGAEALSGVSAAITSSLDAHAANAPTMADTQEQMDADRAIPPFDLTATEPANVYKYDDLITPAEYEALRQPTKVVGKATRQDVANWRAKGVYSEYMLSHLENMPTNAAARNRMVRTVQYIEYLKQLLENERNLNKEDHGLPFVPAPVRTRMLSLFTQKAEGNNDVVEYKLTRKLKDKIVAYMIVLALHVDGFSVEYEVIAKDLKWDMNKFKAILRGLGLKLDRSGKVAKLTAPIEFPKMNIRKTANS